jgi:muramoyltetrapeptide carboxypeptidase
MSALDTPDRSLVHPSPLGAGARVALVSPAGPLGGPAEVALAEANARAFGWEPVVGRHALARTAYFAGTDAERGADLQTALADPTIDGIWCLRGGYGAMRLLSTLDPEALRRRPRALLGYSDITALHAAWQRAGLVSYHGPTARAELSPFSRASLAAALGGAANPAGHAPDATCIVPGRAEGRLAGGNLALVAALAGTPWAVSFRGAIAVLEDIHEATYRVDRMLVQLRLAGAFDGCRAIMFGHCTDCPDSGDDGRRTLLDLLTELGHALGVPTLMGVPVGHIPDQWTLPLGAMATLDADAHTLHVHRSTP